MTTVLPIDYVTILEAADMLQTAMHAGVPDLPIATKLRQEGFEVNDGPARDRAIAELWKAVDKRSPVDGYRRASPLKRFHSRFAPVLPPIVFTDSEKRAIYVSDLNRIIAPAASP
jgi:hypothetical protein